MANYSITPILFIFPSLSKDNFSNFAHFRQVDEIDMNLL